MSELKLQQCKLDGRYDILECLGRGSYGEVYLARDSAAQGGSPQTVVIKALNIFLQGSIDLELERTLIENFRNEAVALDRVRHPNVINRLGHGTAIDLNGQTFHYLVLEYLSGGTMSDMCRHSPLSIERALLYLDQASAGLQHAHDRGVIHRDIKPQNLLLTSDRQVVKIADFGVAKLDSEGGITRVGTDVYAAPEHHPLLQTGPLDPHMSDAQSSRKLTPAADVYSLAKTTYTILTGEAPRRFSQKPITELPEEFATRPWAAVAVRVLRRATETNPSRRPQTVRDFWSELSDALMPKTQLLTQPPSDESLPPGTDSSPRRDDPRLPPEPLPVSFETAAPPKRPDMATSSARPRIVVPVNSPRAETHLAPAQPSHARQSAPSPRQTTAPADANLKPSRADQPAATAPRSWLVRDGTLRLLVGLLIIAGFALLLLGVYTSVRSRQRQQTSTPAAPRQPGATQSAAPGYQIGREMITTTNVNLRGGPGRTHERIGEVESGSRIRIRAVEGNWVEVDIIERGSPRRDEDGPARGWLDGTRLR